MSHAPSGLAKIVFFFVGFFVHHEIFQERFLENGNEFPKKKNSTVWKSAVLQTSILNSARRRFRQVVHRMFHHKFFGDSATLF